MLRNFFAREELVGRNVEGQTLVEYGLLLALIAVVVIGAVTLIGTNLNGILGQIAAAL